MTFLSFLIFAHLSFSFLFIAVSFSLFVERKNAVKSEVDHQRLAEVFGINLDIDPPMREATLSEEEAAGAGSGSDDDDDSTTGAVKGKGRKKAGAPSAAASSRAKPKPRAKAAASKAKPAAKGGRGRKKKADSDEDMEEEEKEEIEDSEDGGQLEEKETRMYACTTFCLLFSPFGLLFVAGSLTFSSFLRFCFVFFGTSFFFFFFHLLSRMGHRSS